ncbi:hypothetical protein GCM10009630_00240 [Kribbella jejuensis]|uniref:Uncharacterized protein n=1 Tax=Kribbella jejuensis TaxID=236068 RepID=A0A542E8B7_9ACTN|nr:hypothetical protein [Kribbella jejuensis]TQJ11581.1 hypothetical protein FB475_4501 [Kribbella jejuensis]
MTADEKITQWLAELRATSRAVLLARFVIAVAGTVAIVVPTIQPWDQLDLVVYLAVPLLLATVVIPDSVSGTLFLLVVTLGWLMRAPGTITWSLTITAMALATLHLAAAFAAQLPSYAQVHPASLRRWWLPGTTALLLAPAVAGAAALVQNANVPGSLLITVAAIALTAVTLWLITDQKLKRD